MSLGETFQGLKGGCVSSVGLVQCLEYNVKVLGKGGLLCERQQEFMPLAPNSFVFLRETSSFHGSDYSAPAC